MRLFIGHLLLLASITFLLGYYTGLPWWSFAPCAVLTGATFNGGGFSKFFAGVFGVGGVWGAHAYYIHSSEEGTLVPKVAELFEIITSGNPLILVALTAGIGALIAGLSTLTGHSFTQIFKRKRNDNILRRT